MEIPISILEKLSLAGTIVALTGAGVSAESGIQTFRDPDGIWTKMSPYELASAEGFMSNPELVWSWYKQRREMMSSKLPNPAHYGIAEMENIFPGFVLITQNIDRLHQRAGSKRVYELHGNLIDNHCLNCKEPYFDTIDNDSDKPPECNLCGGNVRPSVVWFGEMLPVEALLTAQEASANCDVFFSIGTSAEVYPAAELPLIALRNGAFVVEINPNNTAISAYMNERLKAAAGIAVPALMDSYKKYIGK